MCFATTFNLMAPNSVAGSRSAAPAPCWSTEKQPGVTPIGRLGESEVTTIEGLGTIEKPHPLQRAFMDEQAAKCGYCINGMIMTAKELLDRNPKPSEAEVRDGLDANLCRCGTHGRIIRAVLKAAELAGRI
jgi:nicotinate dehydrogenase subunit A